MSNLIQERITILENKVKDTASSPLFAQLAAYYLEVGRAHDALRVCDAGLAHHPFYTTGHLIKGKALLALAMKSEAAREFEFVADFFPENPEITRLLTSLRTSAEISDQTPRELLAQQEQVVEAPITGKDIPSEWAGMLQDKQPQSTQQTFAQVPSFDYGEIPHADTVSIDTTQPGVRREP
ncbi:MAG: hypothetical protein N3A63_06835, partial [Bacteroidetes bacterium]|nr:hypothetical protein [Bacteroidota bacterium]